MSGFSTGHDPKVPRLLGELIEQNNQKLENLTSILEQANKAQSRSNQIMIWLTWGIFILTGIITFDVLQRLFSK